MSLTFGAILIFIGAILVGLAYHDHMGAALQVLRQ